MEPSLGSMKMNVSPLTNDQSDQPRPEQPIPGSVSGSKSANSGFAIIKKETIKKVHLSEMIYR